MPERKLMIISEAHEKKQTLSRKLSNLSSFDPDKKGSSTTKLPVIKLPKKVEGGRLTRLLSQLANQSA